MITSDAPHAASPYAVERRQLLHELAELSNHSEATQAASVLAWQRRLADAIVRAERDSAATTTDMDRRDEAKLHRHLLRVIGDGLVHDLVPSHTIRALSRHPGKPAHLTSQGEDFDFVFETAERIVSLGGVPILSDLSTLLGIGDLVAITPVGIAVVECKNRPAPTRPPSGRIARQLERGTDATRYLADSYIEEGARSGPMVASLGGPGHRIAIPRELPSPDYRIVERLLDQCTESSDGIAVHAYDTTDVLVAHTSDASPDAVVNELHRVVDQGDIDPSSPMLGISMLAELVDAASYRRVSPSNYPLPPRMRWRLLEKDLRLIRIVDLAALASEFDVDGDTVRLTPVHGKEGLEVLIEGTRADVHKFTRELGELCMWTPIPAAALAESLRDQAKQSIAELAAIASDDIDSMRAEGDSITFTTHYRGPSQTPAEARLNSSSKS